MSLPRWRLVLGKYADQQLGEPAPGQALRMDQALEYLYGREYQGRGLRGATLEPSQMRLVDWLGQVRALFPQETVQIIEKHALERYGLTELVTDARTLEKLEPNQALLRTLLSLRNHLAGDVLVVARRIIRQVVEEIERQLAPQVRQTLGGRINRQRHSPMALLQNFDVHGTVRRNLRHYDVQRRQLVLEQLLFFERNARRLPWEVILCVDQSGSMADSVIHSAVMAGILAGLPAFRIKLVLFDTSIVDLSDHVDDPVEVLLRAQLGGGTDIGRAVRYCSTLVENPQRSVFVLVSDFEEGGSCAELLRAVRHLAEARVTMLGLAALDGQAHPVYDRQMAEQLAACGMEIAALTPQQLAHWLVKVIS